MRYSTISLGEVVKIIMGQAPPSSKCNKDGIGVPFVKAGEFTDITPLVREWTVLPLKSAKSLDVLVCVVGATAGKVSRAIDCAIGRSVAAVRPKEGMIDTGFLFHFLASRTISLRKKSQGLAQGVITRDMLNELTIALPPLNEQRRIAAILDQADALRRKRRETIAQLDCLADSIFIEMFGNPVSNPKGLAIRKLGDLILSASDGPHVSPSYVERGIPFISTRHVKKGNIIWEDLKYVSQSDADIQWKKCKPENNDILYTKGGTTGVAAVVTSTNAFAVWVHVAVLKPDLTKINPIWLEASLNNGAYIPV